MIMAIKNQDPSGSTTSDSFFLPERYFLRLSRVDIAKDLLDAHLLYVLLDIDNTILRRDTHEVPRDIVAWLARAKEAGVSICLLSNNWHANVLELAQTLDLPIVAKALKPLPFGYLRALSKLGAKRKQTVVIGDQLLTDVAGAHLLGMRAYLLAPLVEQDLTHTLLLRNIERTLLKDAQPEGGIAAQSVLEVHEQGREL